MTNNYNNLGASLCHGDKALSRRILSESSRDRIQSAAVHDNFPDFLFMLSPNSEAREGEEINSTAELVKPRFSADLLKTVIELTQLVSHSSAERTK